MKYIDGKICCSCCWFGCLVAFVLDDANSWLAPTLLDFTMVLQLTPSLFLSHSLYKPFLPTSVCLRASVFLYLLHSHLSKVSTLLKFFLILFISSTFPQTSYLSTTFSPLPRLPPPLTFALLRHQRCLASHSRPSVPVMQCGLVS